MQTHTRRGRVFVRATALLAVLALLGTVWTLRARIEEAWLLRRLERGDSSERRTAALRLGELESTRAIPLLFREFDLENPWSREPASFNRLIWISEEFSSVPVLGELFGEQAAFRALLRIVQARGAAATPYLRSEVGRTNLWASYLALRLVGRFGTPDEATLAAVHRASEHASAGIRKAATHALAQLTRRRLVTGAAGVEETDSPSFN